MRRTRGRIPYDIGTDRGMVLAFIDSSLEFERAGERWRAWATIAALNRQLRPRGYIVERTEGCEGRLSFRVLDVWQGQRCVDRWAVVEGARET